MKIHESIVTRHHNEKGGYKQLPSHAEKKEFIAAADLRANGNLRLS
jgi:hypothetical protein